MSRSLRFCLAVCLAGFTLAFPHSTQAAADNVPSPGGWRWCTDSVINGCIQSVTTTSPAKAETVYTSSTTMPAELMVVVRCTPTGSQNTCDGNRYESATDGPCRQKSTWSASQMVVPALEIDITWPGRSGWNVRVKISTGNFRTAFTIGHGTTSAITTDDGDGTFTYTFSSEIEKSYSGDAPDGIRPGQNNYAEWLLTAAATRFTESIHVQIWPRDHLLDPSKSAAGCGYYPFEGAWAEANANSFSWSYSSALFPSSVAPATVPNKLSFTAQNFHYLPQNGQDPLEVMPARIQVFMPAAYFTALGYSSLSEFDSTSYNVTAEDGQVVSPTITPRDNGLLINLGVQHYSSPNPTIIFKPKTLSAVPNTSSATSTLPKAAFTLSTRKLISATSLAKNAGISVAKGATVSIRVIPASSKVCYVTGVVLKSIKLGTCNVVVTTKSKAGVKKSRTISLSVKR